MHQCYIVNLFTKQGGVYARHVRCEAKRAMLWCVCYMYASVVPWLGGVEKEYLLVWWVVLYTTIPTPIFKPVDILSTPVIVFCKTKLQGSAHGIPRTRIWP